MTDNLIDKLEEKGRQNGRSEDGKEASSGRPQKGMYWDYQTSSLKENPESVYDECYPDNHVVTFDNRWHPENILRPGIQKAVKDLKGSKNKREVLEQLAWDSFLAAVEEFGALAKVFNAIGVGFHYPLKYQFVVPERTGPAKEKDYRPEDWITLPSIDVDEATYEKIQAFADETGLTEHDAIVAMLEIQVGKMLDKSS